MGKEGIEDGKGVNRRWERREKKMGKEGKRRWERKDKRREMGDRTP